jgi:hypothetical protein
MRLRYRSRGLGVSENGPAEVPRRNREPKIPRPVCFRRSLGAQETMNLVPLTAASTVAAVSGLSNGPLGETALAVLSL